MCGISSIWYKYNPDFRPLIAMVEHQKMRGPDKGAFIIEGNIGFGFNRLAIVDLTGGEQPKQNERWVMIFNGEIYNYMGFRGDTEWLFNSLNEKGFDQTIADAEGMFSIAAYDKLERKLYMAVDPLGIKPLYWFSDDESFALASSPGALTHLKPKWKLSREALTDYLSLGATFEPLFEGMHKLKAGHKIEVDSDLKVTVSRYYAPRRDEKMTIADCLSILTDSIKKSAVADVPVTMFLSGGIDSTLVASQLRGMNAVHLASPEEKYARLVAARYSSPLLVVEPKDYSAKECLTDYSRQSGDCSGAAIIPYIVSKEVAKITKCAISSNGADELFVGYDRITQGWKRHLAHMFRGVGDTIPMDNPYQYDPRQMELDYYVQYDLNKTLDFASMCHGLEVRLPYLNKSVVEAAMSIPISKHVNGMGNKSILKNFLRNEGFDDAFLQRPKLGFSLFTEPQGYEELKQAGVAFLRDEFDINPDFDKGTRDEKYFACAAASVYVWHEVWKNKLK